MRLLDIDIELPTTRRLFTGVLFILFFTMLGTVFVHLKLVEAGAVAPTVLAFTFGVVLQTIGISPIKHGWRALVIYLVVATILYGGLRAFYY